MGADNYTKMGNDWCPVCATKLNAASSLEHEHVIPNPGDISICIKCASLLQYSSDMALTELTQKEFSKIPKQERIKLLKTQAFVINEVVKE